MLKLELNDADFHNNSPHIMEHKNIEMPIRMFIPLFHMHSVPTKPTDTQVVQLSLFFPSTICVSFLI